MPRSKDQSAEGKGIPATAIIPSRGEDLAPSVNKNLLGKSFAGKLPQSGTGKFSTKSKSEEMTDAGIVILPPVNQVDKEEYLHELSNAGNQESRDMISRNSSVLQQKESKRTKKEIKRSESRQSQNQQRKAKMAIEHTASTKVIEEEEPL